MSEEKILKELEILESDLKAQGKTEEEINELRETIIDYIRSKKVKEVI